MFSGQVASNVAAFWINDKCKYEWHLANVVEICSNTSISTIIF